jgi:hypothetical protein
VILEEVGVDYGFYRDGDFLFLLEAGLNIRL